MWIKMEEIELMVVFYIDDCCQMIVIKGQMCVYLFFFIVWEIKWMVNYFNVVGLYGKFVRMGYF